MIHAPIRYFANFIVLLFTTALPSTSAEAVLKQDQLVAIGNVGWVVPRFDLPASDPATPIVRANDQDPGAVLLRRLIAQGRAAGFENVIYDNRDGAHSTLDPKQFPTLTHLSYGPKLREQGLDMGLAGKIILPAIVIGNSSTAIETRRIARSQTRLAMTAPLGSQRAYLTYANNHVYVYPEHRDHDGVDRYPANWPYTITSQGSSSSDKPFLSALALTTAAFTTETRDFLFENKLVAPTLNMILRRSLKGVYRREQYLSAAAHPTVFIGENVVSERMVSLANSIKPEDVPPMVRLSVVSEDFSGEAGLLNLTERLFDTPSAIARVWRSPAHVRDITVSASDTRDPNGRDLTYQWVLLKGDPDKVRINKTNASGDRARIRIDWHDRRYVGSGDGRAIDRVDIGVFANNGAHDSAPAILSISFPSHQIREYVEIAQTGQKKLASIDYAAVHRKEYFDPLVHWHANWRDEFTYLPDGTLESWKRTTTDDQEIWLKHQDPSREVSVEYERTDGRKGTEVVMK